MQRSTTTASPQGRRTRCISSSALKYSDKELALICDYLQKTSEISQRELTKAIAANRSRTADVSKWPCARPNIVGLRMVGSYELQRAIERALARKMNLNDGRDLTIIDLLEALLRTEETNPGVKGAELRRKVEDLPQSEALLHEVAVLHWLGGFHETAIAKYLAIGEEVVQQEVKRTREIFFPNAMAYRRTRRLGTEQASK